VEKAGPWKARKTKSRFSSLPTFPTAPTAAGISQTKSGILIVVDRKECLTPDTYRGHEWRVDSFIPARRVYGLIRGDCEAMDWSPEGNFVFVKEAELLAAIDS
jgi:hypothetical protein